MAVESGENRARRMTGLLVVSVAALLASCALAPPPPNLPDVDSGSACARLLSPIAASAIGLPTQGASIDSATLMPAEPMRVLDKPPFTPASPEFAVVPATPEYCKVLGSIAPVDPTAPPIRFQVNLPTRWNGASVQYGGGGFNGVLITGLGLLPSARPDRPSPLMRGYVTYGTDSGHQNAPGVPLQAFALNEEALTNFAYASYKKVRDVAVELMKRRFAMAPNRLYFVGSSEGGREGLTMAQRFPADFDGIFSRVPVINWVGLQVAGTRAGAAQFEGGWLAPAKVKLVGDAVLAACDAGDGLADGIVSNYAGCRTSFDVTRLRCASGADEGASCLSDAQLKTVAALHSPTLFSFPLANGVRIYPAWGVGGEAAAGTGPVGGWPSWQTGSAPPKLPPGPTGSRAWLYGSGAVQYFFLRDGQSDPRHFEPVQHAERLKQVSALMDSTDPDLSAFHARGGKLIVSEHMADYAQSPYAGVQYFRSVQMKMGRFTTSRFMRLYVTPGADHVGVGAPSGIDMLEVLSDWVENGRSPGDLVQSSFTPAAPFKVLESRPMCRFPTWPRFNGEGDPTSARSFECASR